MPYGAAIGLGLILVGAGLLLLVVARRSGNETLPRNWLVGIRSKTTLASDEAWRVAHRVAAQPMAVGSLGSIAAGLILLLRPTNGLGLTVVLLGLAWLLAWVLRGASIGIDAAKRMERHPPQ